jgi:hypothetical protein
MRDGTAQVLLRREAGTRILPRCLDFLERRTYSGRGRLCAVGPAGTEGGTGRGGVGDELIFAAGAAFPSGRTSRAGISRKTRSATSTRCGGTRTPVRFRSESEIESVLWMDWDKCVEMVKKTYGAELHLDGGAGDGRLRAPSALKTYRPKRRERALPLPPFWSAVPSRRRRGYYA